jgi:NAD(P)-dependent dehydrogenase (short-subunit alcohol dehydrogenase family)
MEPMEDKLLPGRCFIVTGGTQGLGRGIALHLGEEGAAGLTICGRNKKNGREAADEISQTGCACEYVQADLFHEKECRKVVQEALKRFGRLDGLVNAAGLTNRGTIEDTTVELWDLLLNVNARAPFILMQETVRFMKAHRVRGSIVNIVSDNYHGGQPYLTVYAASKGALATLTKNAAHALRHDQIRVNGICIGWMYTPHEHQVQVETGRPENWLEIVERDRPFRRLLRPRDVAYLTAYLLSDRSEMMTGSLIDFDQKVIGGLD